MDIKSFVYCAKNLPDDISILIRGNHGIGKSQVIAQLAREFQLKLTDKRLSQLSEGDMIGLPELKDGVTRFAHPDWYVDACENPRVLFFDELNRALPEVMQAAFQIVLDRELNGKRLHPQTRVVAAINDSSVYQVNEMDPALLDRFWTIDLEPTVQDWLDWGARKRADNGGGIHPYLLDFVRANHSAIEPSTKSNPGEVQPSRRSFERGDQVCQKMGFYDAELGAPKGAGSEAAQSMFMLWMGFVGTNVANQIVDFVKNVDKQVSAEDILNGWKKVAKKVEAMGQEKWNICIEKLVKYGRDHVLTEKQANNFGEFVGLLPGELVVHCWTELAKDPNDNSKANIKIVHPHMVGKILPVFGKKPPAPAGK
jgi:hypothetical protein